MSLQGQKIAVVGTGAVGGYYGGKLHATGHDVHFLVRSDLEVVRARGITIREGEKETRLHPVQAHGSPNEIGPVDLIIVAIKCTANDALEKLLPPLIDGNTRLLTLQNGLGNEAFLAAHFHPEHVMGGLCFVCLNRVAPGVIEHYDYGALSLGEYRGAPTRRLLEIVHAFQQAGIETRSVENLATERWRKLVWNIPFNGLSIVAGGIDVEAILSHPPLERLTRQLMEEIVDAAAGLGHRIAPEFIDFQIGRTRTMGHYKPSSLLDFQAGRAIEVEAIWGEPVRQAKAAGLEMPRVEMLYRLLEKLSPA